MGVYSVYFYKYTCCAMFVTIFFKKKEENKQ